MADWPRHLLIDLDKVRLTDKDGHGWLMDGQMFVGCLEAAGWAYRPDDRFLDALQDIEGIVRDDTIASKGLAVLDRIAQVFPPPANAAPGDGSNGGKGTVA